MVSVFLREAKSDCRVLATLPIENISAFTETLSGKHLTFLSWARRQAVAARLRRHPVRLPARAAAMARCPLHRPLHDRVPDPAAHADRALLLSRYGCWSWEDRGAQTLAVVDGAADCMTVVAAWRGVGSPGRASGATFREEWRRARMTGPRTVFLNGFNEWKRHDQPSPEVSKDMSRPPSSVHSIWTSRADKPLRSRRAGSRRRPMGVSDMTARVFGGGTLSSSRDVVRRIEIELDRPGARGGVPGRGQPEPQGHVGPAA